MPTNQGDENALGAHRGPNDWGAGQGNGYDSPQDALDGNAPGFADTFCPCQGGGLSFTDAVEATVGVVAVLMAPEIVAAGADYAAAAGPAATSVAGALSADPDLRAAAIADLKERIATANGCSQMAPSRPATHWWMVPGNTTFAWVGAFIRGFC